MGSCNPLFFSSEYENNLNTIVTPRTGVCGEVLICNLRENHLEIKTQASEERVPELSITLGRDSWGTRT